MANAAPTRLTPVAPEDIKKVDPVAAAEADALAPKDAAPVAPEAPAEAPPAASMDPAAIAAIVAAVMQAMGAKGLALKPTHNTVIPVDTAEYRKAEGAHVGTHDATRKDH